MNETLLELAGDPGLVRIGLPLLRDDPHGCPRGRTLRARPLVKDPARVGRTPFSDFALGPVTDALNLIEHEKKELGAALASATARRKVHPLHRAWTGHAVRTYLAARDREESARRAAGWPATLPVPHEWVAITNMSRPDRRGARRYERTAWGRRYASADGAVRELWLPSVNTAKDDRSEAEIAAAASVVLWGVPAVSQFGRPYDELDHLGDSKPRRVRVLAVGCGDGEVRVLADWDAHETFRKYEELARPALSRVIDRSGLNPGSDCVNCTGLRGCKALARIPALLQVPAPGRPRKRRSVSATDLRIHRECPARFHFTRVLHVKGSHPENAAIRRGRAVDAVLNARHTERPPGGCRHLPLPGGLPGLEETEQEPALRMLDRHRAICPLDGLPSHEQVRVQPRLTAYDPVVDAVIIADPDLLYTDAGGWVWRETKTSRGPLRAGRPLLEQYPQLALAVVLMAAGVLGGDRRRSRIELELLHEGGAACEVIDPFDEPTVEQARSIIADLAGSWAADESYACAPGPHCTGCEALTWCEAGQVTVASGE